MKKTGIYIITNSVNNKIYIGCSTNIHDRWKRHLRDAFNNNCKMYKYPLYRSIRKYGKDNFSFEILLETFDYFYWEKFFIFWHKSNNSKYGYNLTSGGEGSLGCHHSKSAETRKKLSIINRGKRNKKNSDNLKKGFSNGVYVHPRKGKILTDEQRKRISEGHKGIKIPDYYYCKDLDLKCDSTLTASLILGISRETFRRIIKNGGIDNNGYAWKAIFDGSLFNKRKSEIGKRLHREGKLPRGVPGKYKIICIETGEICLHRSEAARKYGFNINTFSRRLKQGRPDINGRHWKEVTA